MLFGKKERQVEQRGSQGASSQTVEGELLTAEETGHDETAEVQSTGALAPLSKVQTALAEVRSVEEVKEVRDKAEAARKYILNAGLGLEALNQAAEIKLRAERKAGEMLRSMHLHGGNRRQKGEHDRMRLEDLGISKDQSSRWQLLARIHEQELDAFIGTFIESNEELTTAAALRFARSFRVKPKPKRKDTVIENGAFEELDSITNRISRGETYGCIYATLPGEIGDNLAELSAVPIRSLAAETGHLHLWVPDDCLFAAQELMIAWGFTYAGVFVWTKPKRGVGKYWKRSHELLLLGIRGDCEFQSKSVSSWITANPPRGGKKPARIRTLIESVSPGPFLELSGTQVAKGWASCPWPQQSTPPVKEEKDDVETTSH